ncbi:MAG: FAD binding domain-containing protein [Halobacteriovoraceae bacterium]|nr:FAD binding domain-containing protein [Halobacteriovoraceae bacterium]
MIRNQLVVYLNGVKKNIAGSHAFLTLAQWLRYEEGKTGTKIVCAEGDCGACTVLAARYRGSDKLEYLPINSCITYPYLLDCCHIITVEGLGSRDEPHEIQEAMAKGNGAQCGYCTPGFICSLAGMFEDLKRNKQKISEKKVKNHLTGNLCRCTGYLSIVDSAMAVDPKNVARISEMYSEVEMLQDFKSAYDNSVAIESENATVYLPKSFDEGIQFLKDQESSVLTSGGTDLGVFSNKGKISLKKIVSLNNIPEAYEINVRNKFLEIGAKASLTEVEKACNQYFPEFSKKLHIFASPQIKNKGTLVGNVANGSPIGDSLPFLMVAGAILVIQGEDGVREININDFYLGYKKFDLQKNEVITKIKIPLSDAIFKLYKISTRKDLDISTVTMGTRIRIKNKKIEEMALAFGGVGPVVMRAKKLEKELVGKTIDSQTFENFATKIYEEIAPIDDLRGSKNFRYLLCKNLFLKLYEDLSREI